MPELVCQPVDMIDVLGVAPEVDEYEIFYRYEVQQAALTIQLTVWPHDRDVEILMRVAPLPEPVLRYSLVDCPGIRMVADKRGKFLEFAAANTFTGRYDGYSVIPYGMRLWVEPQIRLEPFVSRA
ncbi:hypothetical protein EV700_0881 [Fluviicoccus keumensis]|uniref:Uncharacterized protein n=1 Tax=Fluviicoccus keumensis TaxID=1435465 RepID=A0A4Q7ZD06_9GAMM|nr:hypothetical protein [Fluviicoccus keumensis]RZU47913.1 hypothetical protein EV700_0881 [Fluviicoccus keumensis]